MDVSVRCRLLEWRLEKPSEDKNRKKHECVVIVKNLFAPHQFDVSH